MSEAEFITEELVEQRRKAAESIKVYDINKPVVDVTIRRSVIENKLNKMQRMLTKDESILEKYLIPENVQMVEDENVNDYITALSNGEAYTFKTKSGEDICIFMKGVLLDVLLQCGLDCKNLFEQEVVELSVPNVADDIAHMIWKMGFVTIEEGCSVESNLDTLTQLISINFSKDNSGDGSIFDILNEMVTVRLSYGNDRIRECLTQAWNSTADKTSLVCGIQEKYKEIFASSEFTGITTNSIKEAMESLLTEVYHPVQL